MKTPLQGNGIVKARWRLGVNMILESENIFLSSDKLFPSGDCPLTLPNLHFSYYVNEEKQKMKGVCLDFGFFSVRNLTPQKTIETINMIKKELVIMAISHLRFVIKKGDFDLLYTNRVKNGGNEQEDFAKHDNEKHAKLLQISVEKLKEDYPNEQEMINSSLIGVAELAREN